MESTLSNGQCVGDNSITISEWVRAEKKRERIGQMLRRPLEKVLQLKQSHDSSKVLLKGHRLGSGNLSLSLTLPFNHSVIMGNLLNSSRFLFPHL